MIQFGNDKIKEIYHGSNKITEVYHGSDLVWKMDGGIIQDGYWVHKDTNAVTYFGLEDPSIEDGIMGYPAWMPNCSEVKLPSGVTGFKTYNWVIEEWDNWEATYMGFVHSKETYAEGNEVLTVVDLSNTSITYIGGECFYSCTSLTSINLPNSLTSIGDSTFYYCPSLTSITFPDSLTSIGNRAFEECESLTSITLSDSLTSIGNGAFAACTSLTSITLPDSLTSIGDSAFYYCTSLTSITLPESLTSIGNMAFQQCTSLSLVTSLPTIPPSLGGFVFADTHANLIIKVPAQSVNAYETATNWNNYASIISAI